MLLILSARVVGEDIALQFGRVPPAFLPLGDQRLFTWQAELADGEPIAMTLPVDFAISEGDQQEIERLGIQLIRQNPGLSITAAIRHALQELATDTPVRILYGDTLVRLAENPRADAVALQHSSANYQWAYVDGNGFSDEPPQRLDRRQIVCGYFIFQDPVLLRRACQADTIVAALEAYDRGRPLLRLEVPEWYDFGHLPLYYQSRKLLMVKRVFNEIEVVDHRLVKRSGDTLKMRAEAAWFENLPPSLEVHVPRYHGRIDRDFLAGYATEYLYLPVLSDVWAFGALPLASWLEILSACFELLEKCHDIRPPDGSPESSPAFADRFADEMFTSKTWRRLDAYLATADLDIDDELTINGRAFPSLRTVVERVLERVPTTTTDHIRFWHGDVFFGNLLYDFTARRVLAIDPRGQLGSGDLCRFGDWRYDVAKLSHSIVGQYDRIVLNRASLTRHSHLDWTLTIASGRDEGDQLEEIFLAEVQSRYGMAPDETLALTATLFFSMLPLHFERPDRQRQLLANALRVAGKISGMTA